MLFMVFAPLLNFITYSNFTSIVELKLKREPIVPSCRKRFASIVELKPKREPIVPSCRVSVLAVPACPG